VGHAASAAGGCEGLQEIFPDEAADEARGFGKVKPDGKRAELGGEPQLRHSKGELMSSDTVLTQSATKTEQNETFRKVVRVATSWKWFRISRAIYVGA
jgi:hypothetical protein